MNLAAECGHPEAMELDDPAFDPLRGDPGFEALVEKVGTQLAARSEG